MKSVAMMKQAIKDSNKSRLNGYKWTADKNGLHWSYGADFTLTFNEEPEMIKFEDVQTGCKVTTFVVTNKDDEWLCDNYHDFNKTTDEAIYWATKKIIAKASCLY